MNSHGPPNESNHHRQPPQPPLTTDSGQRISECDMMPDVMEEEEEADDREDMDDEEGDDEDEDSEEIFGLRSHQIHFNRSQSSNLISNPFQMHHHLNHLNPPVETPAAEPAASVTVSHKPSSNCSVKQVMTTSLSSDVPEAATIDCSSLTQVMNLAAGLVSSSPPATTTSNTMTRSRSEYSTTTTTRLPVSKTSAAASAVASATTPTPSHPLIQVIRDSVYSSFLYNKQRMQERLLPLLPSSSASSSSSNSGTKSAPTTPTGTSMFLLKTTDPVMESKVRALRCARAHVKQLLRITNGPIMTSLAQVNHSFTQLDQIVKELNSSRMSFSSSHVQSSGSSSSSSSNLDQQIRETAAAFRTIAAEAEKMRTGIAFFNSNLQTLVNKSMADTMRSCDQLESSRIEFDAERNYLLGLQSSGSSAETAYLNERRDRLMQLESTYSNLKKDVLVKMDFLSSNRDKVLNKSLSLVNSLLHSFYIVPTTGTLSKLDSVLKAYSINQQQQQVVAGRGSDGSVVSVSSNKS